MKKVILMIVLTLSALFSIKVFAQTQHLAEQLPEKSIIIGTHVIVLDVLNEELLEIAQASAEKSGQHNIYFKSDINKGVWYDITDKTNITQISITTDNIVKNSVIDALGLTYYTKITGETIDLTTGETVNLSSVLDLTDPNNMTQLDEIKQEKNIQQGLKDNGDKDKQNIYDNKIKSISQVLKRIDHPDITKCSRELLAIEDFLEYAKKQDKTTAEMLQLITEQKKIIRNKKDAYCYQAVLNTITKENEALTSEAYNDLLQKYSTAATNIRASLSELGVSTKDTEDIQQKEYSLAGDSQREQESLEDKTAINTLKDNYIKQMLDCVDNKNNPEAYKLLLKIFAVETVGNGDKNVSEAIANLQKDVLQEIKSTAQAKFDKLISNKEGEEYQKSKAYGETAAVLEQLQQKSLDNYKSCMNEMAQSDANIIDRLDTPVDKVNTLENSKVYYQNKTDSIPPSDISDALKQSIDKNVEQIEAQMNAIKLESITDYKQTKKVIEVLKKTVSDLNEKYLGAVEQADTANISEYKKELDAADDTLLEAQKKLEQIEQDFKNGKIEVDLSKTEQQENTDTNEQGQESKEESKEEDQQSDQEKQDNSAQQKLQDEISKLDTAAALLASNQNSKYSNAEKTKMNNQAEVLKNKNEGYEFIEPWYIIFADYDIKLTEPVMKSGKAIYVPASDLAVQLGAQVLYSQTGEVNIIKYEGVLIEYKLEDKTVYVNDKKMMINPAPVVFVQDKIYIPLECFEKAYNLEETQQQNYIIVTKK